MKRFFFVAAGILFIILGIIGWLVPVIPGWPLLFVGLSMIAPSIFFRYKYRLDQRLFKRDIVYFDEWRQKNVDAGLATKSFPVFLKNTGDLMLPENQEKVRSAFRESPVLKTKKTVFPGRFVFLNQVHGERVVVLEDSVNFKHEGFYRLSETDGVITNLTGLTLLVMTADCLSVYLSAPGWVGLVHAGWRGTQRQIVKIAATLLMKKAGCGARDIEIIFGPSICGRHYEVGEDFTKYFKAPALKRKNGKLYFNLVEENKRQALSLGIPKKNIAVSDHCTVSENSHFYSYRIEKEKAGRIISFIQLRPI